MTDPSLRDPAQNAAYYRSCKGYENNRDRFKEPRVGWVVSRVLAGGPGPLRVLDLACNDGFLAELLPAHVEYHGVELNPVAIANAHPRAKGRIVEGDITTLRHDPGMWDCILALEVLEHLTDPVAFLRGLAPALRPSGRLITTSALGAGEGHEPGNREHLVEWNPAGFAKLHEAAGLKVVEQVVARVYGERYTNGIVATPRTEKA